MPEREEVKPFTAEEALEWARADEDAALRWDRNCPDDNVAKAHAHNLRRRAMTLRAATTALLAEVEQLKAESAANRATIQRLNRRAQKAEGALAKALKEAKPVDTWSSAERRKEAAERDRMMEAVGKAGQFNG